MRIILSTLLLAGLSVSCNASDSQTTNEQSARQTAPANETKLAFIPKHVDAAAADTLIGSGSETRILDVRTPAEFSAGHIEGAINIDFNGSDFESQLSALDRNIPYLVHCHSGRRSTLALTTLEDLEFTDITHLDGGIKAWQSSGLVVTAPCEGRC